MASLKKQLKEAQRRLAGDRDQVLLDHILKKDLNHATSHLGNVTTQDSEFANPDIPWAKTKKCRVAMVMAPAWGVIFPPYNIAKLTALLRKFDYSVKVYDLNVESYHHLKKLKNEDFWRGEKYFLWSDKENFEKILLPDLVELFDKIVDNIVASKPKIIGLSIYNTNIYASIYIAKKIREKLPYVCLLAGGPEVITGESNFKENGLAYNIFNYVFTGEAEENLINLLENFPKEVPYNTIIGSITSRLKLEDYPYPDYTDYNINSYVERGISIETSRGCVAQCSFCAETYFWKFRSLTPERVVNEIEYQVKKHEFKRLWFVDSLANGHVKNFEKIVDLLIEKDLDISWNSYVRCDGRMDFNLFQKIKKSGCSALSFGVESGSQKVLDDMRKKIEVWEIENNLRDCKGSLIFTHVNWIIGFATEEPIDYFHSLQLIFNARKWIDAISPGMTAGLALNSHSHTDFKLYKIAGNQVYWDTKFLGQWYTTDYKNTIVNRFIRLKLFHIWLDILTDYNESQIVNSQRHSNIKEFYDFRIYSRKGVEYVNQDFNINFNIFGDDLEDHIATEYVSFCYALYFMIGSCYFKVICDPKEDLKTFGDFLVRRYHSEFIFDVKENGNFGFTLNHKLDGEFNRSIIINGNIKDWQTETPQIRECIHEQYRKKND